MTLPDSISFDAFSLVRMHSAKRRRLLEVTLAKFDVSVPSIAVYRYLLSKAYVGKNVETEMEILKDIYNILPFDEKVMITASKLEAKLMKKGLKMELADIITGVTSILNRSLLVSADPSRYTPLTEFGLDVMDLEKFLREVERIIEEELGD
jgi:predicted nucleic acid-binding protein